MSLYEDLGGVSGSRWASPESFSVSCAVEEQLYQAYVSRVAGEHIHPFHTKFVG